MGKLGFGLTVAGVLWVATKMLMGPSSGARARPPITVAKPRFQITDQGTQNYEFFTLFFRNFTDRIPDLLVWWKEVENFYHCSKADVTSSPQHTKSTSRDGERAMRNDAATCRNDLQHAATAQQRCQSQFSNCGFKNVVLRTRSKSCG